MGLYLSQDFGVNGLGLPPPPPPPTKKKKTVPICGEALAARCAAEAGAAVFRQGCICTLGF